MTRFCALLLAGVLAPFMTSTAAASPDAWPSKPIRLIVPVPAGGLVDVFARKFAESVSTDLKQPVIVENKPGAMGLIGAQAVSNGPADNHTIYVLVTNLIITAATGQFDILKELKPVTRLTATPSLCVVPIDSPWHTMGDLVAAIRAKPNEVRYATGGVGSPAHMAMLYLDSAVGGLKAVAVPYKGAPDSINALLGGQLEFSIVVMGAATPQIKAGRLRALGVTSRSRVPQLPDVPTFAEALGHPYVYESWMGVAMHTATPDSIVDRVAAAFQHALKTPGVQRLLETTGTFADASASPEAFAKQIEEDVAKEREMLKSIPPIEK